MHFTKLQANGNDYIYIDTFREKVEQPNRLSRILSDRHLGVGGDGLILIGPGRNAPLSMRMFNADGLEGEMCGNGLRCLAKYAFDHGLVKERRFHVETGAGPKTIEILEVGDGGVQQIAINMGPPIWSPELIPVDFNGAEALRLPLTVNGYPLELNCINTGVPHIVIFLTQEPKNFPVEQLGPLLENHPLFPQRANINFAYCVNRNLILQRTWERGSGETQACGTGSTAIFACAHKLGLCDHIATIRSPGGVLEISYQNNDLIMTGPAHEVFNGDFNPDFLLKIYS